MKQFTLILFLSIGGLLKAQSLSEASRLFDRFEYAKAAAVFEQIAAKKTLHLEDYKRLAYCYFSTGEFDKCYPLVDSLTKIGNTEPFFYYALGTVYMYKSDYAKAKSAFLNYQSKDNEFPVDILIASCDSIPTWKTAVLKENSLSIENGTKADINGNGLNNGYFIFKEVGIDSLGNEIPMESIDMAEVVLLKPYYLLSDGTLQRITLPDTYKHAVVSSLTYLSESGEVLLTVAEPLSKENKRKSQHLYSAKLDMINFAFSDLNPWIYSGYEDTTACMGATINGSGNRIVFSKMGNQTANADLYETRLEQGAWSKPQPLSDLNTTFTEVFPQFSGDSLLSFASDGRPGYGSLDVFTVNINDASFGPIHHLNAPLNSYSDDFNFVYLSDSTALYSSNRTGGKGDDDIYKVSLYYKKGPTAEELLAEELDRFVKGWEDQRVYFDFASYNLNDFVKMDSLVFFLKNSPASYVNIEGHTDSRGTEEYNNDLSYFRGNVIKTELLKKGVNENQIKIISKGKTDPQVACEKGCTEEQHAQNRVAIIKLQVH